MDDGRQEIDPGNTVTPTLTTCCCLGLLRPTELDEEPQIIILRQDNIYFGQILVLPETTDQKVYIRCVNGNHTVTSVLVTRSHLAIEFEVGMTTDLTVGDMLRIGSFQRVYEYKVVCVDDEILKRNREKLNREQIIRNGAREENTTNSDGNDDVNDINNSYHYNANNGYYLHNYPSPPGYNGFNEPRAAIHKPKGCKTVFVGNLYWYIDEDTLRDTSAVCGTITQIHFSTDQETGHLKGTGIFYSLIQKLLTKP